MVPMDFWGMRQEMIEGQLKVRGILDSRVLDTMLNTPRESFVPEKLHSLAYADRPLPIGEEQTISQPYIVAFMAEALQLTGVERVLEIGTGCGYNAAILAQLAKHVFSVEYRPALAEIAKKNLERLQINNVSLKVGDGNLGWPEEAPFDRIVLTAAPLQVPPPLLEQLEVGGKLVAPVGDLFQNLQLHQLTESGWTVQDLLPVQFVPLIRV